MENIISMGTLYLNGRPVGAQTACPEDIQDIRLGDTVSTVCFTAFIGSGAWLVVVVNDIHVLRFTTVAAFASPIVVNIVAHIHSLSIVVVQC